MRLAMVLILCSISIAHADDREAARRAFRTADRAYKAQNFEAALHHYEEAYKHLPAPEIAFSAAQAYRKQYRIDPKVEYVLRAIVLYETYLAKVKTGGRVSDASDNLGEMKIELLQLQARGVVMSAAPTAPARTRLAISPQLRSDGRRDVLTEVSDQRDDGEPRYAVTIDGKAVAPFTPIDVTAGPHRVKVEAGGYLPTETIARAIDGVSSVAEIALVPRPGLISVQTEAGADISIDGRSVGTEQLTTFALPAGPHVLSISRRGRRAMAKEIILERGATLSLREPLAVTAQRRAARWVAIGAGVLALVSIGSTIYAAIEDERAENRHDELVRGDGSIALANSIDDAIRSRDRLSTAAWIAGGAALATGFAAAGLYWFDSPKPERLQIAPTGAGMAIRGRF